MNMTMQKLTLKDFETKSADVVTPKIFWIA